MILSMFLQGGETIRAKKDKKIKDKKDVTKDLLFEFYCTWYLCFMKLCPIIGFRLTSNIS